MKPLLIFGTGEIADFAQLFFNRDGQYMVMGFVVDDEYVEGEFHRHLPLHPLSRVMQKAPPDKFACHVALSYARLNQNRQKAYEAMKGLGYEMVSYISPDIIDEYPDTYEVGDNCFILGNQTIQPGVKIGNNVMIWNHNHIGHGTHIGDHTYIASGVILSGHCRIGQRCFFGVNSAVADFIKVGDDCFITMGANVVADIEAGSVVLPARGTTFGPDDEKSSRIIRSYFFK